MTDHDRPQLTVEQVLIIKQSAERLRREFDGTFNLETIEQYIANSQEVLQRTASFTNWFPLLIERLTRDRLRALARLEGAPERPAVLFVCVHNAGRSQMAAGLLRHLAAGHVDVFSGGTEPSDETNAVAVAAMREIGIDISHELPQPWTDEFARAADVIVSMGCGDACPIHPGKRYEDWDIDDPDGQDLATVREIRDDIRTRVESLIARLGVATAAGTPA